MKYRIELGILVRFEPQGLVGLSFVVRKTRLHSCKGAGERGPLFQYRGIPDPPSIPPKAYAYQRAAKPFKLRKDLAGAH